MMDGPPVFEIPAWAALALGGVEALVVLVGLVAAAWLLTRHADDDPGTRRP